MQLHPWFGCSFVYIVQKLIIFKQLDEGQLMTLLWSYARLLYTVSICYLSNVFTKCTTIFQCTLWRRHGCQKRYNMLTHFLIKSTPSAYGTAYSFWCKWYYTIIWSCHYVLWLCLWLAFCITRKTFQILRSLWSDAKHKYRWKRINMSLTVTWEKWRLCLEEKHYVRLLFQCCLVTD